MEARSFTTIRPGSPGKCLVLPPTWMTRRLLERAEAAPVAESSTTTHSSGLRPRR